MSAAAKYLRIARLSFSNAVQYRANVLTGFLFYAMFIFVFFNLWRAIYAGGQVEGYTFRQMLWYLCVTELVAYGARVRIHVEIAADVKSGSIAYQLLRPYRFIGYQAANALGQVLFSLAAYSAMALLLGFVMVGPIEGFQPWTIAPAFLSLVLGIALNFLLLLLIGLCAFRIEDISGLYLIYSKLVFMTGTFIPLEFLPRWLADIARYLPFPFVSWGPAKLMVAFSWPDFCFIVPMQLLYIAVATLGAVALYRSGIKNLQTNGG